MTPSHSFAHVIRDRRSVRAYLPRAVPDEVLREVLVLARCAPSGANLQPGSFVAVRGEARRPSEVDIERIGTLRNRVRRERTLA